MSVARVPHVVFTPNPCSGLVLGAWLNVNRSIESWSNASDGLVLQHFGCSAVLLGQLARACGKAMRREPRSPHTRHTDHANQVATDSKSWKAMKSTLAPFCPKAGHRSNLIIPEISLCCRRQRQAPGRGGSLLFLEKFPCHNTLFRKRLTVSTPAG